MARKKRARREQRKRRRKRQKVRSRVGLTKDDLAQMNRPYFESLPNGKLVEVACTLHDFAVELVERLEQDSSNSSKPPSSDSPYDKRTGEQGDGCGSDGESPAAPCEAHKADDGPSTTEQTSSSAPKRSPGKQPGDKGKWRTEPLEPEATIAHYPERCAACQKELSEAEATKPHAGHHVLELERNASGFRIVCTLHHYYAALCACGHQTKARPGQGYVSVVEGRKKDLRLQENVLVGPMLATFIASLSSRYRMSRAKIQEFLADWAKTKLGIGTIDRCIREAGIACNPVVEDLLDQLQEARIVHADETPWPQWQRMRYLWVFISSTIAIYHIGSRKKEELLKLLTEAYVGWLVTDGYKAYRDRKKRQRCLAHLIRKAVALSRAVSTEAQRFGQWLLRELRGLIQTIAQGGEEARRRTNPILARLKRACLLGKKRDHSKLRALAKEILNDWDAVVAFVKNPGLPPTNNEAERALRHAVIARRISYGTRTSEGSRAYANLLSVVETCRLRKVDPWSYIADVIRLARKGLPPPPIPAPEKA